MPSTPPPFRLQGRHGARRQRGQGAHLHPRRLRQAPGLPGGDPKHVALRGAAEGELGGASATVGVGLEAQAARGGAVRSGRGCLWSLPAGETHPCTAQPCHAGAAAGAADRAAAPAALHRVHSRHREGRPGACGLCAGAWATLRACAAAHTRHRSLHFLLPHVVAPSACNPLPSPRRPWSPRARRATLFTLWRRAAAWWWGPRARWALFGPIL